MPKDTITQLLEKVASGKVSVKDARLALEDASLTEEEMDAAINHGVFNPAAVSYTHLTLPTKA